uniref:RING-type domain-containing protein n=1 Tax=Quercus lobata TaxID=97700 RepID=A0A7N2KMN5_QUELO
MTSVVEIDGHQLVNALQPLSIQDHGDDKRDQSQMQSKKEIEEKGFENHGGICAVCLNQIVLEETALVKGCEHAYCSAALVFGFWLYCDFHLGW